MPSARPIPLGIGSYAGIAWGPGAQVQVVDSDLEETPSMRTNDQVRTGAHGTWTGADYFDGRNLTITFVVLGLSSNDLRTQLASIEQAWVPNSTEGPLWLYDTNRFLNARVRRRRFEHSRGGTGFTTRVIVQFYARDPFYYGAQQNVTVGPAVVSGGLAWPIAWPISWGSVVTGGAVINNLGVVETAPIIQVPGPATNPAITSDTLAASIRVNVALASGEVLLIDTDSRTVRLQNGPTRDSSVDPSSRWWKLQPGVNNIRYSSGSGAPTEYASLLYSPAWP